MATKKSSPIKAPAKKEKSTMIKIAETIGQVAAEISVKKDQFTDMASQAIDAVKSKVHEITAPKVEPVKKAAKVVAKKAAPKKVVPKKVAAVKKSVKKVVKQANKKAAPVKKAAKKTVKKVNRKK